MVKNSDSSWCPCGDSRGLNNITTPDRYPLPNMQDLSGKLAGCTIFSRLDLVKGYHQVSVADTDGPKTTIITPFGLYEHIFMPFGLKNTAQCPVFSVPDGLPPDGHPPHLCLPG